MKSADEYRKNADECRKLAKAMSNPEDKVLLEKMAESWDGLADDREKDPR
jgi:hypothetical protein